MPGTDGLLHVSEIANHRVKDVRDELKEGEQILVKVINIDPTGQDSPEPQGAAAGRGRGAEGLTRERGTSEVRRLAVPDLLSHRNLTPIPSVLSFTPSKLELREIASRGRDPLADRRMAVEQPLHDLRRLAPRPGSARRDGASPR